MTVTVQTPIKTYTAAAAASVFPYDFKIFAGADLVVKVDGVTKTLSTHYTVSGAGVATGGNVTFLSAMVGGESIIIRRDLANKRDTNYQEGGDLLGATHNNDHDYPIMLIQELEERLSRAIQLPDTSTGVDVTLPAPEAGKGFIWNAAADALIAVAFATGTTLVDLAASTGAALIGFIHSATSAVARTVLNRFRDTIHINDFLTTTQIAAAQANSWGSVTNLNAGVQAFLNACAGKRGLVQGGAYYRTTATLNYPNNCVIEGDGPGAVFQGHVADANYATSVGKLGLIRFDNVRFESSGTYSMVLTFTDCGRVEFGPGCSGDFRLTGSLLGSVFIRSYGTREIIVDGQYANVDSFVYADALHTGTAAAGGAATITLAAGASAVNDYYNGRTIKIIGGTGSKQRNAITAYNGTTKVATVSAWGTQPDNTSQYVIQNTGRVVVKSSARFQHDFVGTSNNPTVIYQLNCDHVTGEAGAYAKDIAAGGGSPIAGYFFYQGDGDPDCELDVGACIMEMTIAYPAVMVQASTARRVRHEGRFFGKAIGVSGANYHFNGGGAQSELDIGGYSEQGSVFVVGGASAATAVRYARIRTIVRKCEQNVPPIRCGVLGANYVDLVVLDHPFTYCSYASGITLSQVNRVIAESPVVRNWNTADHADHAAYAYTAGIYIDATPASVVIRDPVIENDTTIVGETGYTRVAIAAANAGAEKNVHVVDARLGTMLDSDYVNLVPDNGTYTPVLSNTANVAASTANVCTFARVGDSCTVSGSAIVDPTAAGPTATQLGISLPIVSNFTDSTQAGGTGASGSTASETYVIYADATFDRVVLDGLARDAGSHTVWFSFTYRIK